MLRYIMKRILWMVPVVIGVICIVFILSVITPGDPVSTLIGSDATPEAYAAMRAQLGLDKPVYVQFANYIIKIVTKGDLGKSYATNQPVMTEILDRFPVTLKLTLASVIVSLILSIPLGLISAVKRYSWIDNASMAISLLGVSIPQFWFGLLTLLLFAVQLRWLPASGVNGIAGWVLPVAMIGVGNMGNFARTTRASMLEVIQQDYMRTARAKGQTEAAVIIKHGLRNALIPIVANVGNVLGISLGGAVIAENIFSIAGVGKYMLDAINARNWPSVQGGIILLAIAFSIIMLGMDLLYAAIDPRLKSEFRARGKKRVQRKVQVA
jgi:peptide/nickel transport system permease protein